MVQSKLPNKRMGSEEVEKNCFQYRFFWTHLNTFENLRPFWFQLGVCTQLLFLLLFSFLNITFWNHKSTNRPIRLNLLEHFVHYWMNSTLFVCSHARVQTCYESTSEPKTYFFSKWIKNYFVTIPMLLFCIIWIIRKVLKSVSAGRIKVCSKFNCTELWIAAL